jgi:hypothetical protein
MIMHDLLGLMAFVGLIAAQFLAVLFVRHDAQPSREHAAEPKPAPHHARTWSIWLSAQG